MILDRSRRFAARVGAIGVLCAICAQAGASTVSLGALSYDTFIPASSSSPGVDAFNLANLTGSFGLPPDFPVVDNLIFENATLTLNPPGQASELFTLGDVGPGFLLDINGNPVVQVPSTQSFASAEFIATLSATVFALADGTTFTAGSPAIDLVLLPSQGANLTADVDQTTIDVSSPISFTPEPKSWVMTLLALLGLMRRGWPR